MSRDEAALSSEPDHEADLIASASAVSGADRQGLNDPGFLAALRTQMVKFARLHLGDGHLAEDAVQEALAGAWTGAQRFAGRAAIKTWVFAILKNKVADLLRHKQRMVDASSLLKEGEEQSMSDLFDERGHWLQDSSPTAWHCPEASLEQQQFWAVLEVCLDGMPASQARVFMMREFMGFETDEICSTVGITSSNVFVQLHRARLRLRECLNQRWFAQAA
ncbi:MAG TPA: sigma-70 family RNA polymerase sigma factor [Aquabacterium sp.]|uniref:sigma-70 family RNA polymerase sigma factor n=1 Tax=Aquabacterium sp. TaxID=1872578 RepID=UPI002E2EAE07|nr:sigma-70 family RNA polymerase sigma factor [Aquabacterium sp.]HEX5356288.1 sigma-70 family RNA polymerase sigma factor [Aquabacterium sp.]